MKISKIFYAWIALTVCFLESRAEVTLPNIIGNDMVLQRSKPVPVWGNAAAGEDVTVKFGNQVKHVKADASGKWQVVLAAMPASDQGREMQISGSNTITLTNILVGEVWLCAGQSNMLYEMRKNSKVVYPYVTEGDSPVTELDHAHNPAIRIFSVTQKKSYQARP